MPGRNGFWAAARIRQAERAVDRHTPMVAIAAQAMHGDRETLSRRGGDYIAKPINLEAWT
jgi:CheY-like chemotaxis protein